MNKLLVICGPTATGKTALALSLAKKLAPGSGSELISADSRQVYKGMDIGTGKDLPPNTKYKILKTKLGGYYKVSGVRIWGYDLVDPKEEFSVALYIKVANKIIDEIWKQGKLPILVGGTGLYIKGVIDGIETVGVKKSFRLRKSLEDKNIEELYGILAQLDPVKAASLNRSDRKNPRRLVRAIEIAQSKIVKVKKESKAVIHDDVLMIGLKADKKFLDEKIEKRVDRRLSGGFESEVQKLLNAGVSWNFQSMSSLGYRQMRDYFKGKASKDEAIKRWKSEEKKYAKRQMTWFKRDKRINWFDVGKGGWEQSVEKLVKRWYKSE